jgi:hypothetical protein
MNLLFLDPALRDIQRLKEFLLSGELSEDRSNQIVDGLIRSIRTLKEQPFLGFSIGGKYGFNTSYRGFLSGQYISIYEITRNTIEIRRIYSVKENYLHDIINRHSE